MRRMFDKEEISNIAGGGIGELKSIDFPYGQENVTYDTTDGITLDADARLTHGVNNDTTDVPTTFSVPLIASTGLILDADETNTHAEIKVNDNIARLTDTSKQYVMPCWRGTEWTQYPLTETSIASYSIVQRTSLGQVRVGTPTEDNMATPKSYVDAAVAGAGGGSNTTLICTNDNYPTYTYTFPANKAVKIEYCLKAQGIIDQATLSVILNGTTPKTIYSNKVAAGSDEMISGTLYYFAGNNSNYPTSGGANTAAGPAIISSCTSPTGTELMQGAGTDYTSITFTADVTGPTGSTVFGAIQFTQLS